MSKKIILIFFLMLFFIPLIHAFTYSAAPQVRVTLASQTPDPVEPGEIVTVRFNIQNNGTETPYDAIVIIHPNYPFSLYGSKAEVNLGRLPAGTAGTKAATVEYKLKVDPEAVEGKTELELEVKVGDGSVTFNSDEFLIDIQTRDALIDLRSITLDPEMISPGETAELTILLKNNADSILRDVVLKLNLSETSLPFAPYQSSSQRSMAQLPAGYQNTLYFKLIAKPDASPGLYKVPLYLTYTDQKGKSFTITDVIAVPLGDTPKVKPYIKKSSILQPDQEGKVTIEVANAGTTDVKYVELYLLPSEDYTLLATSDYIYIGDIAADDTESEELQFYVPKNTLNVSIPVKLKYVDAHNRPFQQDFDLLLHLYSPRDLRRFGLLETSYWYIYFILLLLIIGGYIYYKRYYQKKR